jgi:uncharacterized protein YdaU (DUF1376 family)
MNYYERHIGDYLKDTAHLSLLEHGVYGRLLDVYYTRESAIPADQAARLIGARSKDELAALQVVLAEFFVQEENGDWVQMRCEDEIKRYQDKQGKARASANARWSKHDAHSEGNANAYADAMRTQCEGNATRGRARARAPARPQTPDTSLHSESEIPQQRARATRLPADWSPSQELADWARAERPDLDPRKTLERFRDFWTAKSGQGATKLDWGATFRNWVRSERAQPQSLNGRGHTGDIFGQ